jgi:TolB-like protein/class 3 adenylate cyclase/tetratricopeptide (TPR) repeat protein
MKQPVERRLAAILAADVAGYSRMMGADEEGTHERLRAHLRDLVDPKIKEHRGRIVKNTGDGVLIEFPSVVDAVRCAVEVQREMAERNADVLTEERIEFRIGINLGDVIVEEQDIFGDGVNVAARLEALAAPGGICISRVVRDQVRDKLPYGFEDLGEQRVKNIARPVRIYRVSDIRAGPQIPPAPAPPVLPLPDKPSIAVLPFANMSGDPEQEYFADGMVEEITTAISRLPWLFVIARNSSFTYKGRAVDVRQVARELGVRYVLEGSVRKAGNRVRISGQLIDTGTGAHIWADRFDGALDDIFDLQDQVAGRVVCAIEPKLRSSEIARATRKPTESLDAYDLYLRALGQHYKFTPESMRVAIELLGRALAIDPSYAPAAALVGACRIAQRIQGWHRLSDKERAEAVRLARGAIVTGRDDPDALSLAALTIAYLAGDHATAARAIDRALALNPNSVCAWVNRGWVECWQNRPGPAIQAVERAMRQCPLGPDGHAFKTQLAMAHLAAGRYEEAMGWVDQAVHERPEGVAAIRLKAVLCGLLGRIEEGKQWLGRLSQLTPDATIDRFNVQTSTFLAPEIRTVMTEGLRRAGMPEE